jgi:hypothetical protein
MVAALPKTIYVILVASLLMPFLHLCVRVASDDPRPDSRVLLCVGIGGSLLVYPWADFASQGHLDDVLVLYGCAGMLYALRRRSRTQLGLAFSLAVVAKPTALLVLPVLIIGGFTAISIAVAITALAWLPFFLVDPTGFLSASRGVTEVRPGSFPAVIGNEIWGPTPPWIRILALCGGAALCWVFVRRGDAARGMLAAFALRAIVDPNPAQCYASSLVALGLLADVRYRRVPYTAILGLAGWLISEPVMREPILGWARFLLTALVPAVSPGPKRLDHAEVVDNDPSFSGVEEGASLTRE